LEKSWGRRSLLIYSGRYPTARIPGQGIGKCIMNAIMDYLNTYTFHRNFVGLMAAKETPGFYEQYGFTKRPPEGPGMFKIRNGIFMRKGGSKHV
jgi:hypothetical protein